MLWRAHLEGLLPGTWLLLYGCAVLSASTVTIASTMRLLCIMGALFVVLGSFAFVLPAGSHIGDAWRRASASCTSSSATWWDRSDHAA